MPVFAEVLLISPNSCEGGAISPTYALLAEGTARRRCGALPSYIYQIVQTSESKTFASDSEENKLNLDWIPGALVFPASRWLFSPLYSRVTLAGLRRVFSRARILESRVTDERRDPQPERLLLGRGDIHGRYLFFGPGDLFPW